MFRSNEHCEESADHSAFLRARQIKVSDSRAFEKINAIGGVFPDALYGIVVSVKDLYQMFPHSRNMPLFQDSNIEADGRSRRVHMGRREETNCQSFRGSVRLLIHKERFEHGAKRGEDRDGGRFPHGKSTISSFKCAAGEIAIS
jgi:hypothetical protein